MLGLGLGGAGSDTVRGWSTCTFRGGASIASLPMISCISLASSNTAKAFAFFFTQGQDIRHSLLLLVVGHDVVLKRVDIFMTRQLDYYGGGNT